MKRLGGQELQEVVRLGRPEKAIKAKSAGEKTKSCLNYWQSCGEEDDWNNAGIQRINGSIVFG